MTIACCFVVPEGIVLGADSTITTVIDGRPHYLNHNQKVFQVGEDSQYGIVTWGLTSFGDVSYRTLIGRLADKFEEAAPPSVLDAANIWSNLIWEAYKDAFSKEMERFRELESVISGRAEPTTKREISEDKSQRDELNEIFANLRVGFCIAGYSKRDRMPRAFEIDLNPQLRSQPVAQKVERLRHFGNDDVVSRIIGVFSDEIKRSILNSTFWTGDDRDLNNILANMKLDRPDMTIRDAIDFVHYTIYSTIKATKFSTRDKDCGGPIELAVITTDRKFRWVQHKDWNSAIADWNS
jgi:20S proteasome alpha/beta subunit